MSSGHARRQRVTRLVYWLLPRLRLVLGKPEAAPSVVVPFTRDQNAG